MIQIQGFRDGEGRIEDRTTYTFVICLINSMEFNGSTNTVIT